MSTATLRNCRGHPHDRLPDQHGIHFLGTVSRGFDFSWLDRIGVMEHVLYLYDGLVTVLAFVLYLALVVVAISSVGIIYCLITENITRRIVWVPLVMLLFCALILFCWYVGAVEQGYFS